jgi:hypothetical protein
MRDADALRPVCFQLARSAPPAMTSRITARSYASESPRDSRESSGARNLQAFRSELRMVAQLPPNRRQCERLNQRHVVIFIERSHACVISEQSHRLLFHRVGVPDLLDVCLIAEPVLELHFLQDEDVLSPQVEKVARPCEDVLLRVPYDLDQLPELDLITRDLNSQALEA